MQWEADGWAVYPAERTYPHPTRGPPGSDRYLPETQSLPTRSKPPRLMQSVGGMPGHARRRCHASSVVFHRAALGRTVRHELLHRADKFSRRSVCIVRVSGLYPRRIREPGRRSAPVLRLSTAHPPSQHLCGSGDIQPDGPWAALAPRTIAASRKSCRSIRIWMPYAPPSAVSRPAATPPYSSVGIAWAMRLLASSWREVWGHSVHPMDHNTDVQKVIVLLTDGGGQSPVQCL